MTSFHSTHLTITVEVFQISDAERLSGGLEEGKVSTGSPLLHGEGQVLETRFSRPGWKMQNFGSASSVALQGANTG